MGSIPTWGSLDQPADTENGNAHITPVGVCSPRSRQALTTDAGEMLCSKKRRGTGWVAM